MRGRFSSKMSSKSQVQTLKFQSNVESLNIAKSDPLIASEFMRLTISLRAWMLAIWQLQSPKEMSTSRAVCTISPLGGTSLRRLTASAIGTWRT